LGEEIVANSILVVLTYILIIKFYRISYLTNCYFTIHLNTIYSTLYTIKAGVPQESVIAPFLYSIFIYDIPKTFNISLSTYADDIIITASHQNHVTAGDMIQNYLNIISLRANSCKIKINKLKFIQATSSLRNIDSSPAKLN